jgi:hypothetical protein
MQKRCMIDDRSSIVAWSITCKLKVKGVAGTFCTVTTVTKKQNREAGRPRVLALFKPLFSLIRPWTESYHLHV